jgi:putative phage-type endonuclease
VSFCPPERRSIITASDAPIILGVSPHHDATWLYAYKLGLIEDSDNAAKAMGRRLEPVILDLLREKHRLEIYSNVTLIDGPVPWMKATPDGGVDTDQRIPPHEDRMTHVVEAKAALWLSPTQWSGGPPPQFIAQCQHQMAVCGTDRALLGCLISAGTAGGLLFKSVEMHRNESFIKGMLAKEAEFHDRVTRQLGPPVTAGSDKESTLKALAAIYPVGAPTVATLPADAVQWWSLLEHNRKQTQELRRMDRQVRIALQASMGAASLGLLPDGRALHLKITRDKRTGKPVRKLRLFRPGDSL